MNSPLIRVALADDHPMVRAGMQAALSEHPLITVVGVAANSTELMALLRLSPCDVLVTDFAMPGGDHGDGLEMLQLVKVHYPQLSLVVMTGIDQGALVRAILAQGVGGLISKADDVSHVSMAVMAVRARRQYLSPTISDLVGVATDGAGTTKLSPRERQVLTLFVAGLSINEIAARLSLRKQTVSTQKVSGMAKLGLERDADLFRHAVDLGLSPPTTD